MSVDAPQSVEHLHALHSLWQSQLESSHAALLAAHQRCAELASSQQSKESLTASLFAVERRALLEQLQSLCRDKLALKKQLTDRRRDRGRLHYPPHAADPIASSLSHPADNGTVLPSPPSAIAASSTSLPFSSSSSSSSPPSISSSDLLLRSEIDELRSQVQRLRVDRQSLSSLLHQREAELDDAERSLSRLSRERDRLLERLREMEERAMGQLDANAAMQEALRRALEKERAWMEERAEIEREMERMGGSEGAVQQQRREGGRGVGSAYGQQTDRQALRASMRRRDSLDSEDSETSFEPSDRDDRIE